MLTIRFPLLGLCALTALVVAQDVSSLVEDAHNIQPSGYFPVYNNDPSPNPIPRSFLGDTFRRLGGPPSKRHNDDSKEYLYDDNHEIAGFIDRETGQTRIFPDYGALKPLTGPVDLKAAFVILEKQGNAFPPDDTRVELKEGSSLLGFDGKQALAEGSGTVARRWNDAGSTFLTTGMVRRFVDLDSGNKLHVCGPGSQAAFGIGQDNKFLSLSYQWKTAKKSHKKRKTLPVKKVVKQIEEALKK